MFRMSAQGVRRYDEAHFEAHLRLKIRSAIGKTSATEVKRTDATHSTSAVCSFQPIPCTVKFAAGRWLLLSDLGQEILQYD